jgi:prephenate dehydratase
MSASPEAGEEPAVGYLGPEGTFSEQAVLAGALPESVQPVGLSSIYDTVMALRRGELRWALVPIENSLEGSISVTLDLLAGEERDVCIVGETILRVSHSLIGAHDVTLDEIDTVLTHPQVPGQCERFLRGELAHARVLAAASTAEAVRAVVGEGLRTRAAIGTTLAASIYGGVVIREGIEDRDDNETRFVWLARREDAHPEPPLRADGGRAWRTSLLFWGAGTERPGWLLRCLQEFAAREINLTRIESRPRRRRLGSYMFFTDAEGQAAEPAMAAAIEGLSGLCEEVRVLGSYAAAQAPQAGGAGAPDAPAA